MCPFLVLHSVYFHGSLFAQEGYLLLFAQEGYMLLFLSLVFFSSSKFWDVRTRVESVKIYDNIYFSVLFSFSIFFF